MIEIFPLDKVVIEGVSVYLGMAQSDVEAALGKGLFAGNRHYYFNNEMAIDYDSAMKTAFIEFLGGVSGHLQPHIYGVSAFGSSADDLVRILKAKNGGKVEETENGYCDAFHTIGVGIYREATPSDVLEMAQELKAAGISPDGHPALEAERQNAAHWATIGIGSASYYL